MSRLRVAVVVLIISLAGCTGGLPSDVGPSSDSGPDADPDTVEPAPTAEGTLEVHYIAVGQAASVLVIGPEGETMLIDSGHFNDDGRFVIEYLDGLGIDRLDYLVTSHPDADHIGGHADVIEHFETTGDGVGEIYDPGIPSNTQTYEQYLDAVEEHNVTLIEARAGDEIPMAGMRADILGPPEGYLAGEDPNENSLVLQLGHGETSMLLTGDAESEAEAFLVEEYGDRLETTVMKAGHHGSSSSTSAALLDAAQPQAAVISSPYDSQYGHPHDETLQRLGTRSIATYWTATHGTTVFQSNGTHVSVATQQAAPTAPLSLREGTPIEPGDSTELVERAVINASGGVRESDSTPAVTDGGTTVDDGAASGIAVAEVNYDAAGDDRENLNDEYVVFENTDTEPIDLSGWTVEDDAGATYTFPEGTTLDPDAELTLRTGSGNDTSTELYWGSGAPIWNNDGDTVIVTNATGQQVFTEDY
jgi:competence protein ComEC